MILAISCEDCSIRPIAETASGRWRASSRRAACLLHDGARLTGALAGIANRLGDGASAAAASIEAACCSVRLAMASALAIILASGAGNIAGGHRNLANGSRFSVVTAALKSVRVRPLPIERL